ncbi:Tn7-like element transposition protein TnsE [Stutzerimonas balearica]|uniref:Tn7-like element transposition protein TnsE n=1 Tax=Stutzerimonas balearica TaxID=74829 RepID=UPI001F52B263|nr:Tn7-like element transposition protein TnsE [Stutzerimonas balearica]WAN09777.1 Tn7-like element transposition protein TnsE [Stutzerimonas balearica]
MSEGSIASGEFQQLGEGEGDGDEHERLADRFSLLREILEQITQESGVALVALEVRPLPPVPRCSYHMIDHEKSRCYLLARFKLRNGEQRYLLEIDTSDNRKTMSTRIMGFKAGVEAGKCIDRILRETVKGSLRWPGTMAKYCEPLHSVHHPKESSSGANHARVFDWKQRIRAALG